MTEVLTRCFAWSFESRGLRGSRHGVRPLYNMVSPADKARHRNGASLHAPVEELFLFLSGV